MASIDTMAKVADELATRAQPHTVASRLTLRDLRKVIEAEHLGCHNLAEAVKRWSDQLPDNVAAPADEAAAFLWRAAEALDRAWEAALPDLTRLAAADSPQARKTPGRSLLLSAAGQFIAGARAFGNHMSEAWAPAALGSSSDREAWTEKLRLIITSVGSSLSHLALLYDSLADQSGITGSGVLDCMVSARREAERAAQRLQVIQVVMRG